MLIAIATRIKTISFKRNKLSDSQLVNLHAISGSPSHETCQNDSFRVANELTATVYEIQWGISEVEVNPLFQDVRYCSALTLKAISMYNDCNCG
jgi:hypothetical protein